MIGVGLVLFLLMFIGIKLYQGASLHDFDTNSNTWDYL